MRGRNSLSWVLGATALALVGSSVAEEALPMCDPLVSAFFRFDTAGNSTTSGPWRDSYPGCNAVLNSLSHTQNSAGYTTGEGKAAAPCLNLPYGASSWGLLSGTTYKTPCVATGTLSKNIPNMSDANNGWTIGMWVKMDSNAILNSKPDVTADGIGSIASSLKVNTLLSAAESSLADYQALVDLFKSDSWNYVALTYNPAWPSTNNAYRLYLNVGNSSAAETQKAVMWGGTNKGTVPYTMPFSISGSTLTVGGQVGATLEEPQVLELLGMTTTIYGLKVDFFGKIDDMTIINRCLTSNEVARLCSKAETYVFLTKDDASGKYSFSANHSWSSTEGNYANHAPEAQRHYLVDEGRWMRTATSGNFTFGGDSLTLGRVGGTAGNLYQLTPGTVTVPELRLNNGQIKVGANGTLAGNIALKAAPLDLVSDGGAWSYTWAAAITNGAVNKNIRVKATSGSLKVKFDVPNTFTAYEGTVLVDGSGSTAVFPPAKFSKLQNVPQFSNGAVLAASANNDVLAGLPGLLSAGENYIDVPAGETFTLATTITGTFTKRGAGTLILQTTGTGKVNLSAGTMLVDPASSANVGNVTGGTLQVYTENAASYGTASYTGSTISGGSTLVFDVNSANGSHDAMALGSGAISSTAQNPVHIQLNGALTATNSFALFTLPAASGVTADNFDLASVVGLGFGAEIDVRAEGGNLVVYVDVDNSARYVIASDTFEAPAAGTPTTSLTGWTAVDEGDGVGGVVAEAPTLPSPTTYPANDAAHTKVLEVEKNATRTYSENIVRDNQILDSLVKVTWSSPEEMADISSAAAFQLAVTFDEEGWLCVYHPDANGAGHWSRLYFGANSVFARNSWVRLSCVFDYHDDPLDAYGQIRANGSCGVLWDATNNRASAEGVRSPRNHAPKGSWFKLFPKAKTEMKVSQFDVKGQSRIDDVVLAGYERSLVPFEDGAFGATQTSYTAGGKTETFLFSLLDNRWGLPRDLSGDTDGDGYTDGEELMRHSNPYDAKSTPKTITFMILR